MHTIVKVTLGALGALAMAVPASAQQGGQQAPRQGAQQPPAPGAQGAQQGGQGQGQGGPRRQGGGGGAGGPPRPAPNTGVPLVAAFAGTSHTTVIVDPPKGTVCWMTFRMPGTSGEIRQGSSAVVRLNPLAGGCSQVAAAQGQAMIDNPAAYSVVIGDKQAPLTK